MTGRGWLVVAFLCAALGVIAGFWAAVWELDS